MSQDEAMPGRLVMRLFGEVEVEVGGQSLPRLSYQKGLRLLAYFVMNHDRAVSRAIIKKTFWPELSNPESVLQATLTDLRRALGDSARLSSPEHGYLKFNLQAGDKIDVITFDEAIKEALQYADSAKLQEAIKLYQEILLAGWEEEWVKKARQERSRRYRHVLERFRNRAMQDRRYEDALLYLRSLMRARLKEGAGWHQLVGAYVDNENNEKAYEVYKELEAFLQEIKPPSPESRRELERIPEAERKQLEERHKKLTSASIDILPRSDILIGRDSALHKIQELLLGDNSHLIVLTGSGGVGKTRLAIEVGHQVRLRFPHGVKFVDLTSVTNPAEVITKICSTLQISENPSEPEKQKGLVSWLQAKEVLLILDNCEHLLETCAKLAHDLLSSCPQLYILATSRHAFNINEIAWEVPCLEFPSLSMPAAIEALRHYSAIELFEVRAQRAKRTFELTPTNAPAVAEICRRLDGIPLAIELAAARIKALSPQEIAASLNDRFPILTQDNRKVREHHKTLKALIEWSYKLLDESECLLFDRLSVFAGGCTAQAAIEICAGEGLDTPQIQDSVAELIESSLLERSGETESRYRMLETIREYSRECLEATGEVNKWRQRHRDYFVILAETLNRKLGGEGHAQYLDKMAAEYANLEQAGSFSLEDPEGAQDGLRLGSALQEFWWTRGYLNEGRKYYMAVLSRPDAQKRTTARASALNGAGTLARIQGDAPAAHLLHKESLEIFQELGDRPNIAHAYGNLGIVFWYLNQTEDTRFHFEESLKIHRELQNHGGIGNALGNLGVLAFNQKDYASAIPRFEECLALNRESGNPATIALCLSHLGQASYNQKDYGSAIPRFKESLEISYRLTYNSTIIWCLESLAGLACDEHQWVRGTLLYGVSERFREDMDSTPPKSSEELDKYSHQLADARQALGEERFSQTWAQGRAMPLQQGVEYALSSID